ncbi:hypothetical protein shim_12000 [Shimia sp. SK013]|uniref:hypothetical protein n=1 Tax=Shimia sp. SK013 TaxID=1389006 RepID=UPI0006B454FD|nr:hypothetical protein [Shimia sp. SK013]KPA22910.1 hypothetical protein shim_12000 [Shimia sp. SK013]
MLGVVLWHDTNSNRAVIWCEDHGDLAYFDGCEALRDCEIAQIGAGDLVRFDVSEGRNRRFARNPTPVGQGNFSDLPQVLREAETPPKKHTPRRNRARSALALQSKPRDSNVVRLWPIAMTAAAAD